MFELAKFKKKETSLFIPSSKRCKNIFKENGLSIIKIEALRFKMSPAILLYDFPTQSYSSLKCPNTCKHFSTHFT